MRSSNGVNPVSSHTTDEERFVCVGVCVNCMCALSAAGQCTQRGVAVQAAICFRGQGGVTAWVCGLCGHG